MDDDGESENVVVTRRQPGPPSPPAARPARSFWLAGLLGALVGSACEPAPPPGPYNVLLVVIDTLRADHLGCYGYGRPTSPRLDQLAGQGARAAVARAPSSWTLPSIGSILTGVYPAVHGLEHGDAILSDTLPTLPGDFRSAGYTTAAFSANPAFVTPRQGLARDFDRFEVLHGERVGPRTQGAAPFQMGARQWVVETPADVVTDEAISWVEQRDPSRPFFLYLHYFDPHAAYSPPPADAERFGIAADNPLLGQSQWEILLRRHATPPTDLQTLVALYDAEIYRTDRAIGRLLDALGPDVRGTTLVVVTSDHGEEFYDHGGLQHGRTLYDELLHVPLIISGPRVPASHVFHQPVSLAALRATLWDLAGLPPKSAVGIEPSFAPLVRGRSDVAPPVYADLQPRFEEDEWIHRRAVIEERWKLLLSPAEGRELFALARDPRESHDLEVEEPDVVERLRLQVAERDARAGVRRTAAPPTRKALEDSVREKLRALGYLQ